MSDTIFALSSGALPAGVAVVRLSGPMVRPALENLFGRVPEPRHAAYGRVTGDNGVLIDNGLAFFFPAPASFTGEDVAEFHLHGGRAVVARMLDELSALPGMRSAEQGEFTKRAFLNGKLDLTSAEALADLIESETEAQRRFALSNASGRQRELYDGWRDRLVNARAMLEAELDFSDQEDVPDSVSEPVRRELDTLTREMETHIEGFHRAEILRSGFDVVIVGPPNAGKSSLLNALARRDVALVSDEPGTTRDLIEVSLDLGGIKTRITDTAGIREGAGKVEHMGIERAKTRAGEADLVVQLMDLTNPDGMRPVEGALVVGSKCDLPSAVNFEGLHISVRTGEGLTELLSEIETRAKAASGGVSDVLPAQQRHRELLVRALGHVQDACDRFGAQAELQAEALRLASQEIGRITGQVDVEDILGAIFSRFCIGK